MIGGLVPHAGYVYSGPCAAHFYALLDNSIQRVILLGVNHQARGHRAALSPADFWQTPLGIVRIDQESNHLLQDAVHFLKQDEVAHAREHSIEVQLPFLQRVLGEFVPDSHITRPHLYRRMCRTRNGYRRSYAEQQTVGKQNRHDGKQRPKPLSIAQRDR